MGILDTIKDVTGINALAKGVRDVTGATAITKALNGANDGHTTSGMDKAMQDHADKVHPVTGGRMSLPSDDNSFPK